MPRCPTVLSAALLCSAVGVSSTTAGSEDPADLIVSNASVYTGPATRAQALAIRGGRIVAVGSDSEVLRRRGPSTRLIDAAGRLVIPGINDAHTHWGTQPSGTSLELASMEPSWDEVLAALATARTRSPRGSWIFGAFGSRVIDDPRATRSALDAAAPEHTVLLSAWTGHGVLLSTAAMRALAVPEDLPDASDGRVGRDAQGRFDGWLYEYPQWRATDRLNQLVPREQAIRDMRAWAKQAAGFGITSLQVMPAVPVDEFAAMLRAAGVRLRIRIIAFPKTRAEPQRHLDGTDRVRLSGIKWILDGTPVERGAAVRAAYLDRPASRGSLDFPESFVREALRTAASRGEQSLFHCAGDRSAESVVSAMEAGGGIDWPGRRVRIEHGDGVLSDLVPRAARLGVVVVQNPTHFTLADLMRARFGPRHGYMPLRSLLGAGIHVALGSDGPMNPYLNIQLASIHPARPEEALTLDQALEAYTQGSAFAELAEADKGRLAPGQLADLAILSQDIFAVPADALAATTSVLSLVGGEVVYDAEARRPD